MIDATTTFLSCMNTTASVAPKWFTTIIAAIRRAVSQECDNNRLLMNNYEGKKSQVACIFQLIRMLEKHTCRYFLDAATSGS